MERGMGGEVLLYKACHTEVNVVLWTLWYRILTGPEAPDPKQSAPWKRKGGGGALTFCKPTLFFASTGASLGARNHPAAFLFPTPFNKVQTLHSPPYPACQKPGVVLVQCVWFSLLVQLVWWG